MHEYNLATFDSEKEFVHLQCADYNNISNTTTITDSQLKQCDDTDGLITIESEFEKEENKALMQFIEDSDDSIKDPDYKVSEESDEELDNRNKENEGEIHNNEGVANNINQNDQVEASNSRSCNAASSVRRKERCRTMKLKQE